MQELRWLDQLPEGSLVGGVKLLNELHWNIAIKEVEGHWLVGAGHKVLLKTESRDAADAFLYGVALAYSLLPPKLLEQLRSEMDAAAR